MLFRSVIGGYFPGPHGIDSLIVGYYDGDKLMYVARTRNGFVPASRRQVFSKLKHLVTPTCPFVNLPETRRSRFGEELNAEKMKKAVWLRPEAVAQIEFLEWTDADRGVNSQTWPKSVEKASSLDRIWMVGKPSFTRLCQGCPSSDHNRGLDPGKSPVNILLRALNE